MAPSTVTTEGRGGEPALIHRLSAGPLGTPPPIEATVTGSQCGAGLGSRAGFPPPPARSVTDKRAVSAVTELMLIDDGRCHVSRKTL